MEGLAPSLKCLIEIQSALLNGEPARAGLERYVAGSAVDEAFARDVRRFLFDWDQGRDWRSGVAAIESPHRRALLELAACGMSGQAILAHVAELRGEIERASENEIRARLDLLPLRMLFPLLFLLFPSYLLLLFGPVMSAFLRELSR